MEPNQYVLMNFGIESKKLTRFSYTNKQEMIVVKIKKFWSENNNLIVILTQKISIKDF